MLVHVVFPTTCPASRTLLAVFPNSQSLTRGQLLTAYWMYFVTFTDPFRFDTSMRQIPSYGKTRTAVLQSDGGRTMIDSVVWAQHINVADT